MKIEYEATFLNIEKNEVRERLKSAGAVLIKPEFLQKRVVFNFPAGHEIPGGWLRVRDEKDKITMSLKVIDGDRIEDQRETCLRVDSFEEAAGFLKSIGCSQKSYQENYRELWVLDDVEITLDEWPYLEPYVEVEGGSEEAVRAVSAKIGFDYSQALFGAVGVIYNKKYGIPIDDINNRIPLITFQEPNPFIDLCPKN